MLAFSQVFGNFIVNLRKNEGFLTSIMNQRKQSWPLIVCSMLSDPLLSLVHVVSVCLVCVLIQRDASVKHTLGCLWYVLQKIRRH